MEPEKLERLRIAEKEPVVPLKRRRWRVFWVVLLLFGVALVAHLLHSRGFLSPAETVRLVAVSSVYPSQTITQFNASGYVVAQRKASVASKGTGRLQFIHVVEGSRLKEGEIIAGLENDDLKAEKRQAEAQLAAARMDLVRARTDLENANRNWKRYRNLWHEGVISRFSYENAQDQLTKSRALADSAEAAVKALEAAVRRAAILIEYTRIRAPFDGVVLTKDADVGEVVAPFGSSTNAKAAVVSMADLSSLMVEADVSESFLSRVKTGQPCEIQLDSLPDERFPGKVAAIVPTADRTRGTVLVKVSFEQLDPRVLPEMSAKVAFLSRSLTEEEKHPVLGVHRDSITERNGGPGIFVSRDNRATWSPIPSPEFLGDYVLVGDILRGGEKVVMQPPLTLKAGDRLKVAE
ncbi:MAG: efflux RND transporter periplasmic adaptor subunit [Deltaproteobacteria bacterium]|nr:efflux RND transporter periplasmic adaptor subunit [Deltaproteobacteria bacterium]